MNSFLVRTFFVVVAMCLTACTLSPKEKAHNYAVSLGCSLGNGDAYADTASRKVDFNYFPKEELKIFNFEDYTPTESEKEGFKQLFKLSARSCYLDLIRKQDPSKFKL